MAGYTYDKDGIRTSKTVNGVRHDYILNGTTILAELWTENGISYGMYFTYDEKGTPATMEYREGDSTVLYYPKVFGSPEDFFQKVLWSLSHLLRHKKSAERNAQRIFAW